MELYGPFSIRHENEDSASSTITVPFGKCRRAVVLSMPLSTQMRCSADHHHAASDGLAMSGFVVYADDTVKDSAMFAIQRHVFAQGVEFVRVTL